MLTYKTRCDGCGMTVDVWLEGHIVNHDWAVVTFANGNRLDYCPECWSAMFCSLIKPQPKIQAQAQLMAAQAGISQK